MAPPSSIYIVCSDQHRNGKTLLARLLVDFLLLEARDPFVIDLSHPEGTLRSYFPGRTALVDFEQVTGQMKAFDTIMAAPGRAYVIDIPVQHLTGFCDTVIALNVLAELRRRGFRIVILYIIDKAGESLRSAAHAEETLAPDLFVAVRNAFVGSALPADHDGFSIELPALDPALAALVANKRFSFRNFLLGGEAEVPPRLRGSLQSFLFSVLTALREIEPALSLSKLPR